MIFCTRVFSQTDTTKAPAIPKWGWGMELGPGSGMYLLTGDAKEKLSEGWTFFNVDMSLSWNRLHFIAQISGFGSSIKQGLDYGPDWKKDNYIGSTNFQLSTGYNLLEKKYYRILPFVSTGMTAFKTNVDSTGAKSTFSDFKPSYAIGTAFDFKLNWQCLQFRLWTGIYPAYFLAPLKMKGSLCFVNLSLGFYIGPGTRITGIYKES
jgi:hypothetical protein